MFVARCGHAYKELAQERGVDAQTCNKELYTNALEKANTDCEHVLVWFASLDGSIFRLGALVGSYDRKSSKTVKVDHGTKPTVETHADFHYISTMINVHTNSRRAINLMYELALHLPKQFDQLSDLFDTIVEDEVVAETTAAVSGSKRKIT